MTAYNPELCSERHERINDTFEVFDERLGKVENRFLILIASMVVTFLGVIANLVILLLRYHIK